MILISIFNSTFHFNHEQPLIMLVTAPGNRTHHSKTFLQCLFFENLLWKRLHIPDVLHKQLGCILCNKSLLQHSASANEQIIAVTICSRGEKWRQLRIYCRSYTHCFSGAADSVKQFLCLCLKSSELFCSSLQLQVQSS